ncbi:MAG: protein kinase domain-containing protein, partial [Planctomycetota bacterium]
MQEQLPREFGEYRLIRRLGSGGFGVVYEAVHRSLDRTVALKVLKADMDGGAEMLERFELGARAAARVEHAHVVSIYDFGVVSERPFIAMSYLEGESLSALLARVRAVGPPPFGPAHHQV